MNTPSGPGWARFHVEFPGEAGEKEWVTVWAADRSDAVTKAREWIQRRWTKDSRDGWEGPFGGMPVIRKIGEDPDPHDLGVSTDPDEINYGCVSKRGVALSVRLDADRIIEYTCRPRVGAGPARGDGSRSRSRASRRGPSVVRGAGAARMLGGHGRS